MILKKTIKFIILIFLVFSIPLGFLKIEYELSKRIARKFLYQALIDVKEGKTNNNLKNVVHEVEKNCVNYLENEHSSSWTIQQIDNYVNEYDFQVNYEGSSRTYRFFVRTSLFLKTEFSQFWCDNNSNQKNYFK